MSNWYVFYVQTGKEQTACDFLNKLFDKQESVAFIPQVELIFKSSTYVRKEHKPMFPGYVFADSDLSEGIFIKDAYKYARFSKCIFKLLTNNSVDLIKLPDAEKDFLLSLYDNEFIAEESKGIIVGDKISITSGPLVGKESIIKKIDRHKRRAEIELDCLGDIRRISVSLEVISKIPACQ